MDLRPILMLVGAAVFGGLAVLLARTWITAQVPEPIVISEQNVPLTKVVVASQDLYFGSRIRRELVREVDWPQGAVPAGSFSSIEELMSGEERKALRHIATHEPILRSEVSGEGGRASLSGRVGEDMRAISIRVNDVLGVAGFVLPDDRVDILLTREVTKDKPVTVVLIQNVKVLGIDQNANEETEDAQVVRAVTIETTPRQAQKVVLASQVGTLSLALRNYTDADPAATRTVTLADLNVGEVVKENKTAAPVRRRAPSGTSVTITRSLSSRSYRVRSGEAVPAGATKPLVETPRPVASVASPAESFLPLPESVPQSASIPADSSAAMSTMPSPGPADGPPANIVPEAYNQGAGE